MLGRHADPVFAAEQVFQQDFQAKRKIHGTGHRVQPVYLVAGPVHVEGGAAAEAVRGHGVVASSCMVLLSSILPQPDAAATTSGLSGKFLDIKVSP